MVEKRIVLSISAALLFATVSSSSVHAADDALSADVLRGALLGTATPAVAVPKTRGIQAGGEDAGNCSAGICRDIKIEFANNKYTLSKKAKNNLNTLATVLKEAEGTGLKFEISGHTNARGKPEYNDWLSQKRAEAVTAYLVKDKGIPSSMLEPVGEGSRDPLPGVDPKDGRNRRVQVERVN
ncbi:MAG TPA: OmpA family protein [Geminicoccus sp.]|jgi:outer membrane protein OmpA-like peptidoglycan-associated protein|uniref:OmpA family protein n=1 Tax=Geminicoccus sp. TaxID=2024832 RepID=UPI002E365A37|nr:OmpA family protein [Geminicoccus sp.]HEX2526400.1 OmpA family protein [Geminicoccus sp.]